MSIRIDLNQPGTAILTLRLMHGIGQRELARRIAAHTGRTEGNMRAQLWNWETGRRTPDTASLATVLAVLGYSGHVDLADAAPTPPPADHPHTDPGDGRTECDRCGKFVWPVTHSCKGVPVTAAARARQTRAFTCPPGCDLPTGPDITIHNSPGRHTHEVQP